ncbi:MAG: alpha-2-macroglobulin, partial [Chloroflexota bacterium]
MEGIGLPTRFSNVEGTLSVQLDPSLAAVTLDSLNYLRNFPDQCIEQTVSRFLPNVVTYRALHDLGLADADLEASLRTALDFGLTKLEKDQNADGGWGWFGGMESNSLVTAYALLGLTEAQSFASDTDTASAQRAADYLQSQLLKRIDVNTPTWQLNRQAFLIYVLADWKANAALTPFAEALYAYRIELSQAGHAYLLMAYSLLAPEGIEVKNLVSDLVTSAIVSSTGAHWEEVERDGWNWDSDTRTTALALTAIIGAEPDQPLLPNVVRWLVTARRGDHWE